MSDRATLFGLAFGVALLVGAGVGFLAYEAGREGVHTPPSEEPQLSSGLNSTDYSGVQTAC